VTIADTAAGGLPDVLARITTLQSLTAGGAIASAVGGASGTTTAGGDFSATLAGAQQAHAVTGTTTGTATDGMTGGTSTGTAIVTAAAKYLGVPYQWGGTDPSTGLDCSGLVQRAFADLGVRLPRTTYDQANAGTPVASLEQAQPGDLVFFGSPPDHVGIYAGNGQMLDAPHTGAQVRLEPLWGTPTAIRRIQPAGTNGPASTGSAPASAYQQLFEAAGARYGVSPRLLSALAQEESGFTPDAVSSAGAKGLMQLMPATAASLGVDPLDPAQAVDGAARLLGGYLRSYSGSVDLALAAYSAGPGAVAQAGGVPAYAETQNAIRKVHTILGDLRA
jgi:cell wall-associated NlpC family hydrolase